jgi:hypothetical protein
MCPRQKLKTAWMVLVGACFMGTIQVANAQDLESVHPDMGEKAQEYFERGEVLAEIGEYTKAAAAFLLAYETLPHSSALYNIALCYDKAEKIPEAVEYYRRFLEVGMGSDDAKQVLKRLVELDSLVGQIHVTCLASRCKIEINGVDRGEAPLWAVVEPGTHLVTAYSQGMSFGKKEVVVSRAKTSHVSMQPIAPEPTVVPVKRVGSAGNESVAQRPVASRQVKLDRSPKMSVPFWMAAGLTVVGGGMTAVFGAMTQKYSADFEASSNTDNDIKNKGENAVTATNVMIVVTSVGAAAAIGIGIYDLWFAESNASGGQIALVPGPGLGLGLTRRF